MVTPARLAEGAADRGRENLTREIEGGDGGPREPGLLLVGVGVRGSPLPTLEPIVGTHAGDGTADVTPLGLPA